MKRRDCEGQREGEMEDDEEEEEFICLEEKGVGWSGRNSFCIQDNRIVQ